MTAEQATEAELLPANTPRFSALRPYRFKTIISDAREERLYVAHARCASSCLVSLFIECAQSTPYYLVNAFDRELGM